MDKEPFFSSWELCVETYISCQNKNYNQFKGVVHGEKKYSLDIFGRHFVQFSIPKMFSCVNLNNGPENVC